MSPFDSDLRDPVQQLDELGYTVHCEVAEPSLLAALREQVQSLFEVEGQQAGTEFKQEPGARRLANLLNKGNIFQHTVSHPRILPLVSHVLDGSVKLSSLNARSASPYGNAPQPLHCDMAALPDELGNWVCNGVWMLDDFTAENGALRVIPGSHRWKRLPQDELEDPTATHPMERTVTGKAGSVIILNAHTWHGGLANRTPYNRTAIHAFYCRRDKPQQQYQQELLDDDVQQRLSVELRELLALDDPINDQLAAQEVLRSGFLR